MSIKLLAAKIPAKFRREILEMNIINTAIAVPYDPSMQYLLEVYKEYINPNEDAQCGRCLTRVLSHWKDMCPYLLELERSQKLLDSL